MRTRSVGQAHQKRPPGLSLTALVKKTRQLLESSALSASEKERMIRRLLSHFMVPTEVLLAPELTEREQECLALAFQGCDVVETARWLGISPNTVAMHRRNINRKLGCKGKNMLKAILRGVQLGYLSPEKN